MHFAMSNFQIKRLCSDKFASVQGSDVENGEVYKAFGSGQILECLKKNVKDLKNPKCKEVSTVMWVVGFTWK